jgi:drug/metabolite transporter (DMT)-like permease
MKMYRYSISEIQVDKKWFTIVISFGCLANYLVIAGIENVYLAVASLLNNTFPLFVIIVAYFMLKETLKKAQIVAIAFAFLGVILMSLNALTKTDKQDSKGVSA